jgi:hypothetical protein
VRPRQALSLLSPFVFYFLFVSLTSFDSQRGSMVAVIGSPPARQHAIAATSSSQPSRIRPSTSLHRNISTGRHAGSDLGQQLRHTGGRRGKPDGAKVRRTSNIGSLSLTIMVRPPNPIPLPFFLNQIASSHLFSRSSNGRLPLP